MSSPFRGREIPPVGREVPGTARPAAASPGPFPTWAERMHGVQARHEAITRNLNTWSSYKSWAERMRSTWEGDAAPESPQEGNPGGHTVPNH